MFKNKLPGKFIAIEGIDGTGKSTQCHKLKNYLAQLGVAHHLTQEPTNSIIGGIIKGRLNGDWQTVSPLSLQLLFAADRANHLAYEITPKLENGVNVISNRYFLSSIAYGSLDIPDLDWLSQINDLFVLPDLTILLKTSVQTSLQRLQEKKYYLSLFEEKKQLQRVWDTYEKISKKYSNIIVVDGENDVDKIFDEIKEAVNGLLAI
ncbi:MAG: dTMP kinase [Patescibacteria group bacterium]